ncbi:hypothetical protein Fot_15416 [Forsythia ovata]|uniref:Uncharacterized protein n=1 Tax=Forsythia ovata TaxID=205694 RepID=A0ABD1W8N7_9LAMI
MTVRQRSHLSKNHFVRAFILMQDQNHLCEELSATAERYVAEVEEYKKKVDGLSFSVERLEVEVERQTNELEELRKNPEVESLRADVRYLVNELVASCAWAQEIEDKLQKEVEKKREKINSFYIQHVSWEEGLAKKYEKLGVLNAKLESQDLALVEMSAKVEALHNDLLNFKDNDEGKQIFEDGKQAGEMELLDLNKDVPLL